LLDPSNIATLCFGDREKEIDLGSEELSARYSFLRDIVPSSFGIDRLDYLRRDALHTGVKTGDIDIWDIIGKMRVLMHEGRSRLFLMPSAAMAVESLLKAREVVYRQLYYNSTHRIAQELLVRALLALDTLPPPQMNLCYSQTPIFSDYLRNQMLTLCRRQWKGFASESSTKVFR